jgi:hypothetical protein
MAVVDITAVVDPKRSGLMPGERRSIARNPGERAVHELTAALRQAGWTVEPRRDEPGALPEADLIVERRGYRYVVEVKTASEGRSDRILPLWSQACLQVSRLAGGERAMAVVVAPRVPESAAESLLEFAAEYAPHIGAGILDYRGLRRFRGEGLEGLDADPVSDGSPRVSTVRTADLFSDLNQWLLKVLLAPELPEDLLSAPRERYRNASELANAARVSAMSGYRFVQAFKSEGFLETHGRTLRLVRRKGLLAKWRAAAGRPGKEMPMRLLVGTDAYGVAARLAADSSACLGLFAAADALRLGFVSGVPPYVYVRDLGTATRDNLVAAAAHEPPALFVREPKPAESVFRGAVERDGIYVSDALQVWLDVASHPLRGKEQANLIREQVLEPLLGRNIER